MLLLNFEPELAFSRLFLSIGLSGTSNNSQVPQHRKRKIPLKSRL